MKKIKIQYLNDDIKRLEYIDGRRHRPEKK